MSQAPRRVPPPQPTPDDPYQLQPVQPKHSRDLTSEILTISVIVAGIVLLGVGIMLWYRDSRPVRVAPAATATATQLAQAVETATVAVSPPGTPLRPAGTPIARLTPSPPAATPSSELALPLVTGRLATSMPAPPDVHLPDLSSDQPVDEDALTAIAQAATPASDSTPTAAAQAIQILALPLLSAQQPEPTATPLPPTATPIPIATTPGAPVTATSTPGGTPPGTPVTTPTTAPTGLPLVIDDMQAFMRDAADFYIGPSGIYTVTDRLNVDTEISLHGRDRTGEWVLACCVDDDDDDDEPDDRAWVRQAFVRIEGNELDEGEDDDDFDRNDARWLPIVTPRPDLRPLPTVTPPPESDFPLFRYTPDNRAFVPNLPNLSTATRPWTNEPETGGALTSPLIVADSLVFGASADNHVYSWNRDNGSQRARRDLGANVSTKPATDDGLMYFVDDFGILYALQDPIDEEPIWRVDLGLPTNGSVTGINVYSHTLFINLSEVLVVVDGEEGDIRHELPFDTDPVYPAIGGQLVYVVADAVRAYDALVMIEQDFPDLIWEWSDTALAPIPPVYTARGVESLAELYVVGTNNRIYSLDANTGIENWNDDNEESITGLAVSDAALFISGNDYVKARRRDAPEEGVEPILWRTPVAGPVLGGPIVGPQYVILFLQSGNILFLDAATGERRGNFPTYPALPSSSGAVSFPYVFAPGQDGRLYGYRQTP